ncbi:hypothetical protein DFH09DRAFT_1077151 [Mycena vulgaris]|nr:hypothetical protein DFH09DRAFT_1077151 [Mycena vulgaris]
MSWLTRELRRRNIPFDKVERRIRAITDLDFAATDVNDFEPFGDDATTLLDAVDRDPIVTSVLISRINYIILEDLIAAFQIRVSSLRHQYFSAVLKALEMKDLQLLREAIDKFLSSSELEELRKYKLGDKEWEALEAFKKILDVPHAFQQKLSAEKTPTLGHALPAFQLRWFIKFRPEKVEWARDLFKRALRKYKGDVRTSPIRPSDMAVV